MDWTNLTNIILAILTAAIAGAAVCQAWVAVRLLRLEQAIQRAQEKVYISAALNWVEGKFFRIRLLNLSPGGVNVSNLSLAAREPHSNAERTMPLAGTWLIGPFASQDIQPTDSINTLLKDFDLGVKPKLIQIFARFYYTYRHDESWHEVMVFYTHVVRDVGGNVHRVRNSA